MHTLSESHATLLKLAMAHLADELAMLREDHYCYVNSSRVMPFMRLRVRILSMLNAYEMLCSDSTPDERAQLAASNKLFSLLDLLNLNFTRYAQGDAAMSWERILPLVERILAQPIRTLLTKTIKTYEYATE